MKLRVKLSAGPASHDHTLEWPIKASAPRADHGTLRFILDGETAEVDWAEISPGIYSIVTRGKSYEARVTRRFGESPARSGLYQVTVGSRGCLVEVQDPRLHRFQGASIGLEGPQEILAPMPGRVVKVLVSENQQVVQGQGLMVIEAMKMQNELRAPRAGRVNKIHAREGAGVETGAPLLRLV